jgi:hypothetical protein
LRFAGLGTVFEEVGLEPQGVEEVEGS